jgi:Arc/MetJ-type ribon-helix-helix transcriptional regulator
MFTCTIIIYHYSSKADAFNLPQKSKYTTVSIPVTLQDRIEKLIAKKTGFKSVSDYVTYVLREVVAMHETKEVPEPFTSEDIAQIKERLTALGYL